uniref:Cytochrome P450 n=1 Tax=Panagrolaimus sp. ES5 TaxID=591445 RepID=A0AC34FKM9_9BILA
MIGLIISAAFAILCVYNFYWKRKSLPPGPTPFPLIGNFLDFYKHGKSETFEFFRKTYGDLYTLWLGDRPVVVFNKFEEIQEAFIKNGDFYSGRPKNEAMAKVIRNGNYGIIMTEGDVWREHRRFALHVLRNFGLGKNLMQERVLNEVTWFLEDLKKKQKSGEKEISVQNSIDIAVGSIINGLIFGYAFHEVTISEDRKGILRRLPYFKGKFQKAVELGDSMKAFFFGQINDRKAKINFEEDSEPTDYVESYLRQQRKLENSGDKNHMYSDAQLFGCVFDMWLAGQETTSNTLAWMVIYLMTNPEAQKRLHSELDKVIGSDRVITLDDKMNLPFVNAIVAETQRLCNLVPTNVPHRVTQDQNFHGFTIKEDTIAIPQISAVLYDSKFFPEPHKFKPERFIDAAGKFQTKPELIPFSLGKRACLGEGLARLELYLFAANLFNHFEISSIPSNPPDLTRILGGTVSPEPFLAHLKQRY